MNKTIFLIFFS